MTPGNSGSPLLLTEETAADQSVVARLLVWLRPLLEQGIQPRYSATTTEQHSLDHPFIGLPPDRSALVEDESGATYRADTVSIQPPPPAFSRTSKPLQCGHFSMVGTPAVS